jgi:hypothetical protein
MPTTVPFYVNSTNLLVSSVLLLFIRKNSNPGYEGLSFFKQLDTVSWVCLAGLGFVFAVSDAVKYAAYTRREPSSLQIYAFIPRLA